ncbi:glycosyltransferase [Roseivirga thermotolerans]|uniref:glycosyltransferase n=1 Tax=Roseivirga thermotolerans TaxID=1758176 RepID=UPI00273D5F43|nr:glycosyltransferase [Roseivirga thermotolerans]
MKSLIVTNSKLSTGAGVVALDLQHGLEAAGVETDIVVNQYSGTLPKVYNVQSKLVRIISVAIATVVDKLLKAAFTRKLIVKLFGSFKIAKNLIFKMEGANQYFVQDLDQTVNYYSTDKLLKHIKTKSYDGVIVLFMQNFLTFKNLVEISKNYGDIPVFIYLMDMAPITGGCHYAWSCEGYKNDCSACPAVSEDNQHFISSNFEFKLAHSRSSKLQFVSCTGQQLKEVVDSKMVADKPQHKILLPINEKIFHNTAKARQEKRKSLNYTDDDLVIFFGAMNLGNPRKGGKVLLEALMAIAEMGKAKQVKLLIAGGNISFLSALEEPYDLQHLGLVPHHELADVFRAADFFISPSIADSGPMMVNQSVTSGTRVVSFEIGVALDLVVPHEECGITAKTIDGAGLKEAILKEIDLQTSTDRAVLRSKCAERAMELTGSRSTGKQWKELLSTY